MQRLAQMRINGKKPRQDSHVRDRETGYDRLNGLNDGEADLDESAPQAEGDGSEAYLRGVQGPSGEYHFPTHRLRTTMKGKLVLLQGNAMTSSADLNMYRRIQDPARHCRLWLILASHIPPFAYV